VYVQREEIISLVKRIQREVTLSIAQRHDFVRIIHSIIKTYALKVYCKTKRGKGELYRHTVSDFNSMKI